MDAQSNLDDSLRRLRTDHLDLWQFHEIVYDNDPDWIFAKGGAIERAFKALKQGKIRYLGFTGHKDPSIHLKMLDKPYPGRRSRCRSTSWTASSEASSRRSSRFEQPRDRANRHEEPGGNG